MSIEFYLFGLWGNFYWNSFIAKEKKYSFDQNPCSGENSQLYYILTQEIIKINSTKINKKSTLRS